MPEDKVKKKAAVIADLALGSGIREASRKHDVPPTTVKRWHDELQKRNETKQGGTLADARENRFDEAVEHFLHATLKMLNAWAAVCSDINFIKEKPSSVNELGQTILNRADRLVDQITGHKEDDGETEG